MTEKVDAAVGVPPYDLQTSIASSIMCCQEPLPSNYDSGQAFDVILVVNEEEEEDGAGIACSDFLVQFPNVGSSLATKPHSIQFILDDERIKELDAELSSAPENDSGGTGGKWCRFVDGKSTKPPKASLQLILDRLLQKTDRTTMKQQQQQQQQRFSFQYILRDGDGKLLATAEGFIFLWKTSDKILVCDIDGTITKSNIRGLVDTLITSTYTYMHKGVCEFLSRMMIAGATSSDPRLRILYLTSRPIELASKTRTFLTTCQQGASPLPHGPLLGHVGTLMDVITSELKKDIYQHKADHLIRQVVLVFAAARSVANNNNNNHYHTGPLAFGIGNSVTDTMAYEMAGIPLDHIYDVNTSSIVRCFSSGSSSSNSQPSKKSSRQEEDKEEQQQQQQQYRPPSSSSVPIRKPSEYSALRKSGIRFEKGYSDPLLVQDVSEKLQNAFLIVPAAPAQVRDTVVA